MANNINSSLISAYSQLTINNSSVGYSIQSHSLNGLLLDVQQRLAYGNNAPGGQEVFLVFSELKLTYYYQFFKKSSVDKNLNVTTTNISEAFFIQNSSSQFIVIQKSQNTNQTISLYSNATRLNELTTIIPSSSKLIRTVKN